MVSLRLTTEFSEKKMLSVPSVTMNGGSLSRVTSRPLIAPIASAAQEADEQREAAGQPCLRGQVGHDDRGEDGDRAVDRSMPAVRMTSV